MLERAGNSALEAHETLVRRLLDPARYPHPVRAPRLIQTHISSVLLTGDYAYKLKKPLDLGFLDFTTLERRRFCCEEELRLNRRLAPQIYLEVVPIFGSPDDPGFAAAGAAIDYAVRMREFPQQALLDGMLARGELEPRHIDATAAVVAEFHGRIGRAAAGAPFGGAGSIVVPVHQNFIQIRRRLSEAAERAQLGVIESWSLKAMHALAPLFAARQREGFVRECHGDLHLGNIAWVDGAIQVFDCIEFNPGLRWIDVMSEVAFLAMDLTQRSRSDLAWRFLDAWLMHSGDYAGLRLLDFYLVYRALVRAKVARIRAAQAHVTAQERQSALAAYQSYLELAERSTRPAPAALLITHGLSGAGKTTVSQALLERLGCLRLRSDVERKRLAGLAPLAGSDSRLAGGIYTEAATRSTYEELCRLARVVIESGHSAVVDAAFQQRWQRDLLRRLAGELGVPFVIVDCRAPCDVLRRRIGERQRAGADASEATLAVLDHQIAAAQPLAEDELACSVAVDTAAFAPQAAAQRVAQAIAAQRP